MLLTDTLCDAPHICREIEYGKLWDYICGRVAPDYAVVYMQQQQTNTLIPQIKKNIHILGSDKNIILKI